MGMEKGIQQGIEQGIARGKTEGIAEGKAEDTMKMLEIGIPVETISAVIGFSGEEILKMRNAQAV